jgi:hypothetical protein
MPGKGRKDSIASLIVLVLVIIVILLYVGLFIIRPKFGPLPSIGPAIAEAVSQRNSQNVGDSSSTTRKEATGKGAAAKTTRHAGASTAPVPKRPPAKENNEDEGGIPEEEQAAAVAAGKTVEGEAEKPVSKFVPPWMRSKAENEPTEVVIEVPAAVDVPEVRKWPDLKVTAVIGSGAKGSVLVNGYVVSVGEEMEEGPVLKSVSRQAAVFEWDGDRRTIFISSKNE